MHARTILTLALLTAVTLSGCIGAEAGSEDVAPATVSFVDAATAPSDLHVAGVYIHPAGAAADAWNALASNGTVLSFTGAGEDQAITSDVPVGAYDRVRVLFEEAHQDGAVVPMATNGFEIPLAFNVSSVGTTVAITLDFADSFYNSVDGGLAFDPALESVRVLHGTEPVLALDADEIFVGDSIPPVARVRAFQDSGIEVFESDFIADNAVEPVIAAQGNVTFVGTQSEAIHPGAAIEQHIWRFDDGDVLEGPTVTKEFKEGRNWTIELTVVDSMGGEDSQSILVAVIPTFYMVEQSQSVSGIATGDTCYTETGEVIEHALPVDVGAIEDGTTASLVKLVVDMPEHAGDLDIKLFDAAGSQVGASGSLPTFGEGFTRNWADGAPFVSGDWIYEVDPCLAAGTTYTTTFDFTYKVWEAEPAYAKWMAEYDDGHDHQH